MYIAYIILLDSAALEEFAVLWKRRALIRTKAINYYMMGRLVEETS